MVSLDEIRAENAELRSRIEPGTVAVFVGGTSGIGEHTLRAFSKNVDHASIYVVGRNETAASNIISELSKQNSTHKLSFIKADVSLIKNVDAACEEILQKEKKLNYLLLSPGILSMNGRDDTPEHIPRKLALHYYSRSRFIQNLQSLFAAPTLQNRFTTRIVTVLAAGYEDKIKTSDLALQHNYSLRSCAAHATTMSSLHTAHLASQFSGTSFVHSYPGWVRTNIGSDGGRITTMGKSAIFSLAGLFMKVADAEESGERHLWALTSPTFPASSDETLQDSAIGIDGVKGSGAYLIDFNGQKTGNYKVLDPLLKDGWARKVWEHTVQLCDNVVKSGKVQ